ncbi:MAG: hypothetical protein AAB869_01620, partial [Patescibacteria group bacterium]
EGLPGRIWASGKSAWVTDVSLDTTSPRRAVAEEVGFHGAFGFPVRVGSEIEGVIEVIAVAEAEVGVIATNAFVFKQKSALSR